MAEVEIKRGDRFRLELTAADEDGTPINFTGVVVSAALMRRNTIESYEAPFLKITSPTGLTITQTQQETKIVGEFTAAQTRDLPTGTIHFLLRDDTNQLTICESVFRVV